MMRVVISMALFTLVIAKHEEYEGWKSYFIGPTSKPQAIDLHSLSTKLKLSYLSLPHLHREGVVLVQPKDQTEYIKILNFLHIPFKIHAEDVKKQLALDDKNIKSWSYKALRQGKSMPYENYQRLEVIYDYMYHIANKYKHTTKLASAGNSFEGRPIKYMKISTTQFDDKSKPIIFIDAGIHAREWISPPTVTWAIKKLTEDVTDPDLLKNFDWILMPVVNPDGYEYTFTHSRFWRKTRSNNTHDRSYLCPGVDGNRNFDYMWNTMGTDDDPCAENYAGDRAFSELETRAVRNVLLEHKPQIALYLTMHSYGSMILYPWGHRPPNSRDGLNLHTVANKMANAIHKKSLPKLPRYTIGNAALVLSQNFSGDSEDYAHSIGIPFSYTYELPGLSTHLNGFHLEPRYIEQVCRETWAGIVAGAKTIRSLLKEQFD